MKNKRNTYSEAIALLKNLIETQSFSSEEHTAVLIENWFAVNAIPFERKQ
jgi:acetylornithine deacetylase